MKNENWSKLVIPNNPEYLQIILKYCDILAIILGFSKKEIEKILISLDEAISNVMKFAFSDDKTEHFEIIFEKIPKGLKIIIKDKGIPFDAEKFLSEESEDDKHGLYIMKELMDEYYYHNLGKDGKEITLIKYLNNKNITEYLEEDRYKIQIKNNKNIKFKIRILKEDEIVEVSKEIYNAYGYSYLSEDMYYPERIKEFIKNGNLYPAVAVTEDNKIIGYLSLWRDNEKDNIAEIGQAVVNPEYRGNKCLERLTFFLINLAKEKKLSGIFVQAVTNHIYSQKGAHYYGTKDCAIQLGYCPISMEFKKINNDFDQRDSVIISYLSFKKIKSKKIFLPEKHKEIIKKIYNNIGLKPLYTELKENSKRIISKDSIIKTKIFKTANFAKITVFQTGKNLFNELKHTLRKLCIMHIDIIYLHLSLENKQNLPIYNKIEKLNFIFSGIIPNEAIGDTVIYQYLNNVEIDFSKIILHSDFSKVLLSYIKKNYFND